MLGSSHITQPHRWLVVGQYSDHPDCTCVARASGYLVVLLLGFRMIEGTCSADMGTLFRLGREEGT